MKKALLVASLLLAAGCAKTPSAADVCAKLVADGIASNCKEAKPVMISARAKTRVDFDLVHNAGKGGSVLDFAAADDYDATEKAYAAAAMLAGPHRYGNAKARVFVQMASEASLDDGKKAKAVVDAL